jgi:hypothetical protein
MIDLEAPGSLRAASETAAERVRRVRRWAVVWTKPRCERCMCEFFQRENVPCFLPLASRRKNFRSGVKVWTAPLFSSYVFFDQEAIERHRVFDSRKAVEVLTPDDSAALGADLLRIATALERDPSLRESRFTGAGLRVQVNRGPLKGLRGEFVRIGAESLLILRVDFLGKAAELAIDEGCVDPE